MQSKISARDFFLHLGAMVTFYAGTIALITLLFEIINFAYPKITNAYQYYSPSISLQTAILIVVFPLFLFLSRVIQKSYEMEPEKKEYAVRKWLIYITLFVAGIIIAGDLITLIYFFLDGRDLTIAFLLKVLTILVVAGSTFGYFIDDLRDKLTGSRKNMWLIVSVILITGSIIAGFSIIGTPHTQRLMRYDLQKVSDLQSIQWQIVNYWQQKGSLPTSLDDLNDSISGFVVPTDPQTQTAYEFERTGVLSFRLCANFNKETTAGINLSDLPYYTGPTGRAAENWAHGAGRHCFDRVIDPELYPVKPLRQ